MSRMVEHMWFTSRANCPSSSSEVTGTRCSRSPRENALGGTAECGYGLRHPLAHPEQAHYAQYGAQNSLVINITTTRTWIIATRSTSPERFNLDSGDISQKRSSRRAKASRSWTLMAGTRPALTSPNLSRPPRPFRLNARAHPPVRVPLIPEMGSDGLPAHRSGLVIIIGRGDVLEACPSVSSCSCCR